MRLRDYILFMMLLIVLFLPQEARAQSVVEPPDLEEQERLIEFQLKRLGTSEVEAFWQRVREEYDGFLPENQPRELSDFFQFEGSIFSLNLLKGFVLYVFHELLLNGKLLVVIVLLTVFSMILENIQSAFERNNVSKVAYAITYLVIFIIAINSFHVAMTYAQEAIANMVHFMMALIPLLLALIASMGNITTVSLFHPLIIFLINTSGILIHNIVFPLLLFSSILGIVSAFSEQYKVSQLANLLRNLSVGLLGVFLTVFLGVVSVQGATSAVVDGVTVKAAKFVTSNFVPIVGRMFTDATDTVIGASLLIKNTIGLAGVIILILLTAFPALKILTIALIFNFSAAVLQPLGNASVIACLNVIGKNLLFVFAALATVCLMFFLGLTIIIAAGNLSVMVR
ncbi:stage III sporulation protein AE [Caldalkalibacillus thermarum TA2.A1]|uniref:Stage III sporulation protein AE n=1 Tax=Caldalkalibacillus thermarum (strain TA2.A1) TaxID=986075 RepID=A0A8X8L6A8_CALTT|nr:stage III sporulation protein AE [Caldalkalibacillus thermarum]QZT32647.1 stage III sporulation protein AE [Caldalkalibacillus thermarum TA2.A1]